MIPSQLPETMISDDGGTRFVSQHYAYRLAHSLIEKFDRNFPHLTNIPEAELKEIASGMATLFIDNLHMHGKTLQLPEELRIHLAQYARRALLAVGARRMIKLAGEKLPPEVSHAWSAVGGVLTATSVTALHYSSKRIANRYCLYSTRNDHVFGIESDDELVDYKVRSVEFFGETWVYEHNLIVESAGLTNPIFMTTDQSSKIILSSGTSSLGKRNLFGKIKDLCQRVLDSRWWLRRVLDFLHHASSFTQFSVQYKGAWVLSDRKNQANDNAEALFRHLVSHYPNINAWFVLGKNCSSFAELKKLTPKVVPFGSLRHYLLLRNAKLLVCSQSNYESRMPFPNLLKETWEFVYLKHGVIHTDHSRRFNPMQISMVVASSDVERCELVKELNGYRFTPRQVVSAGMPRHDRLFRLANKTNEENVLLLAPTWRIYLATLGKDQNWFLDPGATSSGYITSWRRLLACEGLKSICDSHGLKARLLVHPRFEHYRQVFEAPSWIEVIDYSTDVAKTFAESRVLITDYSSLAYEFAFLNRPTIYFQFDADEFFSGAHSGLLGEFDYELDGFGPVTSTVEECVSAVDLLLSDKALVQSFLRRSEDHFFRDDNSCERTVMALTDRFGVEAGSTLAGARSKTNLG